MQNTCMADRKFVT